MQRPLLDGEHALLEVARPAPDTARGPQRRVGCPAGGARPGSGQRECSTAQRRVVKLGPQLESCLAALFWTMAAPAAMALWDTQALREAMVAALHRRYGITGLTPAAVLPVIGTKELIAWLPTLLDLGWVHRVP